jgi:hypothetical protein
MGRVLTVARVTVTPEHEEEYVRTVHALAEVGLTRGQRLWLFRSTVRPFSYIEFCESRTEFTHRSRASRTELEAKLEERLQAITSYAPDAWDLWDEVPASTPTDSLDE